MSLRGRLTSNGSARPVLSEASAVALAKAADVMRSVLIEQPDTLGDGDCEALHPGFFSQPVNAVTSMSYAVAGAWVIRRLASVEPRHRIGLGGFAGLMILNGLGSVAYHGPQFPGAQALHDLPAFGVAVMAGTVPVVRVLRGRAIAPGWTTRRAAALGGLTVIAGASYLEGRTASRACDPQSWVQLHGLWHMSTAAVMLVTASVLWPDGDLSAEPAQADPSEADPSEGEPSHG